MVKTVTLRLDMPSDRTLHITLPPDVPNGPLEVVLVIAPTSLVDSVSNLAGRWQAYFPSDFDLDSALHEIRHSWEKEWGEVE